MRILITLQVCHNPDIAKIFHKHIYPSLRKNFEPVGTMDLIIVQHLRGYPAIEGAITHDEEFPAYPSLPNYKISTKYSVDNHYDYQFWLEDDVIFWSNCTYKWVEKMNGYVVGSFGVVTNNFIHNHAMLSSYDFNCAFLQEVKHGKWNRYKSEKTVYRLEKKLAILSHNQARSLQDYCTKGRFHYRYTQKSMEALKNALRMWGEHGKNIAEIRSLIL